MPERPLAVATYAAGASLAAITLIYVFAPTYFLDGESSSNTLGLWKSSGNKHAAVGLVNPANDCFINSILQALAGLGDLRRYLIREVHRRSIDETWVYEQAVPETFEANKDKKDRPPTAVWKVEAQQRGLVTHGLKDMLDQLNERPIYKKTISAGPFVKVLEGAFRLRINRSQQDAQEFLQILAESLFEEYQAGCRARAYARWRTGGVRPSSHAGAGYGAPLDTVSSADTPGLEQVEHSRVTASATTDPGRDDPTEEGFPMEGKLESQIECQTCGFKSKPSVSSFCTLMLNVPQVPSTSLSSCFDGMFKTEYIEDFKCDKCRLLHARQVFEAEDSRSTSLEFKAKTRLALDKIQYALDTDPEKPPKDVTLPDSKYAPKRRIARYTRVVEFPKVLAIHLSRSIYNSNQASLKNSAKVAFPERLPLGGLMHRKNYKLLAVVAHKGNHYSGHYESFRRQHTYAPFSNSDTFKSSQVYHQSATPVSTPKLTSIAHPSVASSPRTSITDLTETGPDKQSHQNNQAPTVSLQRTAELTNAKPRSGGESETVARHQDRPYSSGAETSSTRSVVSSLRSTISRATTPRPGARPESSGVLAVAREEGSERRKEAARARPDVHPKARRRKTQDIWWRISDDKIKEASTKELLGMQREVYLLFYELEQDGF